MAKRTKAMIKLHVPGGQATPAPPVGPALGQHGVNIMDFCNMFNSQTQDKQGLIIPVEVSVYEDRTFSFITKSPPASVLLKQAAQIAKASPEPNRQKIATVTRKQLAEIARTKIEDLNASDLESAMSMIAGTARSMGIEVVEE